MIQKFLAAIIGEEWAHECCNISPTPERPLFETSPLAREIGTKTLAFLQANPPPAYHEMGYTLHRIHTECVALLHQFVTDCKLPSSSIPFLGNDVDITGTIPGCFTVDTAQNAIGATYTRLKDMLGKAKKKELAAMGEKRNSIAASIERYLDQKAQYDIRVCAAFASAFVAFRSTPDKVSPVVKGIMNGIKVTTSQPTAFIILTLRSERGKYRPTNPFSCRRCLFHRVLRGPPDHAAAR